MRISSSVFTGTLNLPATGEPNADVTRANAHALAGDAGQIQFGRAAQGSPAQLARRELATDATLPNTPTQAQAPKPAPVSAVPAQAPAATPSADTAFLDNSRFSDAKALERWQPLVAHLPPEQRLAAAQALNRPIAAARMAAGKGPEAEQAMAFINANPALKTAVDVGKSGGNADGKITHKDLKAFAKNMEKAANKADDALADYQKANPNADPQSLQMVRSASLIEANLPLIRAADPRHAAGQEKVDGNISAADLNALAQGNPGLAAPLGQAARLWAQPGFLDQFDQAGKKGRDLAAHSPDQLFDAKNVLSWIRQQAPTSSGQFASMLSDAATINSVSGIDISKLDAKVFEHPKAYTGAQKAAVMVRLQQLQQSVVAGRSLHNTQKTEAGLSEKIAQLQADPDVQAFLNKSIPQQERSLINSDPSLAAAVDQQMKAVSSGEALRADMAAADKRVGKHQPNADYSDAINNLQSQLQLQKELHPGTAVPTADTILNKQPALQARIGESYVRNFAQGGALQQLLARKHVDGQQALAMADAQKAAYDSLLPNDVREAAQGQYLDSTFAQLQGTRKGRKLLEGSGSDQQGPSVAAQLAAQLGPRALQSVMGFASVSDMLARGDKLGAAQTLYESTRTGVQAAKAGVDAGAELLGRQATGGLGRMAGQLAGRAVAAVAGEATGLAAGAAFGAAVPVIGWAIDGAMALGFGISAIVGAIKKKHDQKAFDHNVDPVLNQFGIPKAH